MKVKHKETKVDHNLTDGEWKALQASGHAKNFDNVEGGDYEPNELTLPKNPRSKAEKSE